MKTLFSFFIFLSCSLFGQFALFFPKNLSESIGTNKGSIPKCATNIRGKIVVVWQETNDGDGNNIYGAIWSSESKSWQEPTLLSSDDSITNISVRPQVAVLENGMACVVWYTTEGDPAYGKIYSVINNEDNQWEDLKEVSTGLAGDIYLNPLVSADGSTFVTVFQSISGADINLFAATFDSEGDQEWVNVEQITTSGSVVNNAIDPAIASATAPSIKNLTAVAFRTTNRPEIYVTERENGSWSTPVLISTDTTPSEGRSPSISINSQGNRYIAWAIGASGIFFSQKPDGFDNWSSPIEVSDSASRIGATAPSIGSNTFGEVNVCWLLVSNVYAAQKLKNSDTFLTPKKISTGALSGNASELLLSTSNSGVSGIIFTANPGGQSNVYCTGKVRDQRDWPTPFIVSTSGFGLNNSKSPCIAASSTGGAIATWRDNEDDETGSIYAEIVSIFDGANALMQFSRQTKQYPQTEPINTFRTNLIN